MKEPAFPTCPSLATHRRRQDTSASALPSDGARHIQSRARLILPPLTVASCRALVQSADLETFLPATSNVPVRAQFMNCRDKPGYPLPTRLAAESRRCPPRYYRRRSCAQQYACFNMPEAWVALLISCKLPAGFSSAAAVAPRLRRGLTGCADSEL